MKNFWLNRRPQIIQISDIFNDAYLKWYIRKLNRNITPFVGYGSDSYYLHKDGVWRTTTYNEKIGQYSGYYDTWEEAHAKLMEK